MLWAVGMDSDSCLLGLLKVGGEGTIIGETEDGEDVFEKSDTEGGVIARATGRGEGVFGAESGGVRFFERGGAEKFKLRSEKEEDTLLLVSGAPENLPSVFEGETRSTDGLGDLEDLWSRTVLTEVSEGVVVVLEGLGLFLIRLELAEAD